jgi:L-rhamnose mutarotase
MGMVIGVRPEKIAEYKELAPSPWPETDAALSAANIRNYSMSLREPEHLLFGCSDWGRQSFDG